MDSCRSPRWKQQNNLGQKRITKTGKEKYRKSRGFVLLVFFLYFPFWWMLVSVFNKTKEEANKRKKAEKATSTEGQTNLVPNRKKKPDLEAGYYGGQKPNREDIMSLI